MPNHKKEKVFTPESRQLTSEEIERIKTSWAIPNEKVVTTNLELRV